MRQRSQWRSPSRYRERSLIAVIRSFFHLPVAQARIRADCQVCAPSGNEITCALAALPVQPQILCFTPHSIAEIFRDLRELGAVYRPFGPG